MGKYKMLREINEIFRIKCSFSEEYNKNKSFKDSILLIYEKMSLDELYKANKEIKRITKEKSEVAKCGF